MSKPIACGYARVSTEDQAYRVALSNQVQKLRNSGCIKIYVDVAARSDDRREGITQLLADAEAGMVKSLTVTRLDRLTASPGLFEQIARLLTARQIQLIGLDEYIDITSADGEFSAGLQIYFGKREVRTIQLRSQKGHESRRQNRRANASVPWGYKVVNRAYTLDNTPYLCLLSDRPENGTHPGLSPADLSRDVIALFFEGGSLGKAVNLIHEKYGIFKRGHSKRSKRLTASTYVIEEGDELAGLMHSRSPRKGVFQWSFDGLARWLRSPVLRGHTAYGTRKVLGLDAAGRRRYGCDLPQEEWQIERDTHPEQRLLNEESYEAIEAMIAYNSKTRGYALIGNKDRRYPVSGLLECGMCGARMKSQASRVRAGVKVNYYRCKNSLESACSNRQSLRGDRAEELIIQALVERAEAIAAHASEPEEEIGSPELSQLQEQLRSLGQIAGENPAIEAAKAELQGQVERLTWQLRQVRQRAGVKQQDLVATLAAPYFWQELSSEERGRLFRWLVRRVVVEGDRVEVELDV